MAEAFTQDPDILGLGQEIMPYPDRCARFRGAESYVALTTRMQQQPV